jgi:uncharacterized protein YgbK (DUF1537 family)
MKHLVRCFPRCFVELDTARLAHTARAQVEIDRAAATASRELAASGLAIVATSPKPLDLGLDEARTVAENLAAVIPRLEHSPDVILTKGGITSAVALKAGMGVREAHVIGPIADGVSLWNVKPPKQVGDRSLPWIIFPGNVGSPLLLTRIVQQVLAGRPDAKFPSAR